MIEFLVNLTDIVNGAPNDILVEFFGGFRAPEFNVTLPEEVTMGDLGSSGDFAPTSSPEFALTSSPEFHLDLGGVNVGP